MIHKNHKGFEGSIKSLKPTAVAVEGMNSYAKAINLIADHATISAVA